MTITKIKTSETTISTRKAVILSFSNNPYDDVRQQKLNNCCADNNLEIIQTIKANRDYDPNIFYKLIETINEHDQLITIVIDEYSYSTHSQVMTCCVLATLAMTKVANICTYWESTEGKELKLHCNKDPFNFFLVAEEFFTQLLGIANKEMLNASSTAYKNGGGQ